MTAVASLRPYQLDALAAVRTAHENGARRMLVVAATGAGKTVIFANLPTALGLAPHEKILILAHREELVNQARDKYLAWNPHELVGIEKAERRAAPMDRVAIGSVQTLRGSRLSQFLSRFGQPSLVVTDESHHAAAEGYQAIYRACDITADGGTIHVGVTATPKRSDGIGLQGTFDTVAYSVGIADLIDQGYLVPLVGYRVQTATNLDAVHIKAGDFDQRELNDTVNTPERNARVVSAYADRATGHKAIVFAASVEHSMALRAAFLAAGVRAAHVDGTTPPDERRALLSGFSRGVYDVMTNVGVLTEGYDEPTVSCIVIARPTKSPVLLSQMVGRATRLHPGKNKAIIIDMVDVTRRHSVATLPTLFGMPAAFDPKGTDILAASKTYTKVLKESPDAARFATDADALERIATSESTLRYADAVRELVDKARRSQSYVGIDLLRPPSLDGETAAMTSLTWTQGGDDAFRVRAGDDVVTIVPDLVGKYKASITRSTGGTAAYRDLGTFSKDDAFAIGEDWMRRNHAEEIKLIDRNAGWRNQKASIKQIETLSRFRVEATPDLTRGEASNLLDALFEASRSRKRSA